MVAFDLLLGTDSVWIEGSFQLVKSMPMIIQRAPAAIFACTCMKTLFTSAVTANRTLGTLICIIKKWSVSVCFIEFFLISLQQFDNPSWPKLPNIPYHELTHTAWLAAIQGTSELSFMLSLNRESVILFVMNATVNCDNQLLIPALYSIDIQKL